MPAPGGTLIKIMRGTTDKTSAHTPQHGELMIDMQARKLYVGDGATVGGLLIGSGAPEIFLEKLPTLPAWSSNDLARLIYVEDVDRIYWGSSTDWIQVPLSGGGGGTGSGIGDIILNTSDFVLDNDDDGVDAGFAFNLIECFDFRYDIDGSIVATFPFPASWDETKDIRIKIFYTLNGNDVSKTVRLETSYWVSNSGSTPAYLTPTRTNLIDNIASNTTTNIGKQAEYVLVAGKILNADITLTTKMISIKIKRAASSTLDTYSGTFQLMKAIIYQES